MTSHYTISRAVAFGKSQAALCGSDTALLDAQLLLQHTLQCDRQYLYMYSDKPLTADEWHGYRGLIERRREGHPIAHILGQRDFWSLTLAVDDSTLIPRPDTEIVIEQVLQLALPAQARVLELGCGTGAISLALATEQPDWQFTAVDVAPNAVALARRNVQQHAMNARIEVIQSDWFAAVEGQQFDLIVSNPPYIDEADSHLQQGDVRFEPRSALVAADHGMADLRYIIRQGAKYLNPKGWLILEHGFEQAAKVADIFTEKGYQKVNTAKDYANLDRVTFAQRG
ncbi:peptide chain release factor N(5)-glutamine methyltransferase [Aliidiomarina maris]|uniref:Release factor glutamine methyltransferase n=1 Tax=Aliidiomarina maris TaxID=531312 RepID=A0A327WRN6_9GAMM|nr:peptide chain release factor N(5)-glutamine methyltransferase [Aliidiomarina maris]RAJ93692.1 [protein release factor]-glutamine N5-methyltransferase [Aliidiomarina maris]RUO19409.1 peptide chain release factor N(5)-glutamine methyltransferase [Aliidiomarina maris]